MNLKSCVSEFDTEQTPDVQNMNRKYTAWIENFEVVCDFEDVPAAKKKAALLAVGGAKLRELCKTLNVTATDDYNSTKTKLETHFKVKKNTTAERFKFLNTKPESSEETHDHWVTRLRQKVSDCEFDKLDDNEAIKLVILLHTNNAKLQREIIARDLNYQNTIELARSLELTDREIGNLKGRETHSDPTVLDANKMSLRKSAPPARRTIEVCRYCGEKAPHKECKARNATCHNCSRKGHFAKMCEKPRRSLAEGQGRRTPLEGNATQVTWPQDDEVERVIDALLLNVSMTEEPSLINATYPSTEMQVMVNGVPLTMNIDSMSDANIIGENQFSQVKHAVHLEHSSAQIKPYGSPVIPVVGKFQATLKSQKAQVNTTFYVAKGHGYQALMSKYSAFDLKILKIDASAVKRKVELTLEAPGSTSMSYTEIAKQMTTKESSKQLLKDIYKETADDKARVNLIVGHFGEVFKGIGKHRYRKVKLTVNPDIPPKIQPQRKIAFAKREKLSKLLKVLQEEDIIEHVDGPTDWVSNLVLTPKANPDEIRMNIDMTCANKAILRTFTQFRH